MFKLSTESILPELTMNSNSTPCSPLNICLSELSGPDIVLKVGASKISSISVEATSA